MTSTPHDALFKSVFSSPARAAELLRCLLPPTLARPIDWSSLALLPGSFVDEGLREQHSDLLFAARCGDLDVRVYLLLEHKSTPDAWVPLALHSYMGEIWRRHVATETTAQRLPPILPVVVYHAPRSWTAALEFSQIVDIPPDLELLRAFTPTFRFVLVDLASAEPAAMQAMAVSPATQLAVRALRETRAAPDLLGMLRGWVDLLHAVHHDQDHGGVFAQVLRYVGAVRGPDELRNLDLESITNDGESETAMTKLLEFLDSAFETGEKWGFREGKQAGEQEGLQKGRQQALLELLALKFAAVPPGLVARVEAAGEDTLRQWLARVLTAGSLDEVFAGSPAEAASAGAG